VPTFRRTTEFDYATIGDPQLILKHDIQRDGESIIVRDSDRKLITRLYYSWAYVPAPRSGRNGDEVDEDRWIVLYKMAWPGRSEASLATKGVDKRLISDFIVFTECPRGPTRNIDGARRPVTVAVEF
jgi:hypothetical protein